MCLSHYNFFTHTHKTFASFHNCMVCMCGRIFTYSWNHWKMAKFKLMHIIQLANVLNAEVEFFLFILSFSLPCCVCMRSTSAANGRIVGGTNNCNKIKKKKPVHIDNHKMCTTNGMKRKRKKKEFHSNMQCEDWNVSSFFFFFFLSFEYI